MFSFNAIFTKKTIYLIPMIMKNILLSNLFALITTLGFSQAPSYVPVNGLVGWWPFNGNANDESGNGNNGSNNGATLTTDRNGVVDKAYSFDGINDIIDLGSSVGLNSIIQNFSISYWIKDSSISDNSMVIACFSSGSAGAGWRYHSAIRGDSVDTRFMRADNITWASNITPQNSIQLNSWANIIITRNNSSLSTFKNGNLISQSIVANVPVHSTSTMATTKIGVNWPSLPNTEFFSGKIDDIGIWDRALTTCEILDLYNSQLGSSNTISTQNQTALDSYTWPINNQTYTQGGTYTATIPNAAGCDSTITLNLTMSFTGINDLNATKLSIYPNPTNGDFTITGLELVGTVSSLSLTDMNGKVVKVLDTKATKFSMASIKPGVYFLIIISGNKQEVLKIVKE